MKNMGRLPYRRALRKVYEQRKGLAKTSRPLLNNLKHVSTYIYTCVRDVIRLLCSVIYLSQKVFGNRKRRSRIVNRWLKIFLHTYSTPATAWGELICWAGEGQFDRWLDGRGVDKNLCAGFV